ncbi:biotin/lipoyl-containing protein [Zhongshania sp.]|uniref:biotin/lipoyl-containing protein n=1 Tax=Zhongshania sp. TaxID=1971902 RepID=UPI003568B04D
MSVDIIIPKVGFASSDGTLVKWHAEDGAQVNEGDPLYDLETDKSVQEIFSPASGTLKIIGTEGEEYKVGEVVGVVA